MHPAGGKCFKWPDRKDEYIYLFSVVIMKNLGGRSGQFSFDYFN